MATEDGLPRGWAPIRVGELAEYVNGAAFRPTDWGTHGMPIIRIQNLTDESKTLNRTERQVPSRLRVVAGDVLFSWSATIDAFIWNREPAWLNQHIFRVIPNESMVTKRFLYYLLRLVARDLANGAHLHGSTMKHVNRGPFLDHMVAIPPLDEQRRIVEIIEEQVSRLDAAETNMIRVSDRLWQLSALLQSEAYRYGDRNMRIGQLGDVITGATPPTSDKKYWGGGLPFITPGDLTHGTSIQAWRRSLSIEGQGVGRWVPPEAVLVTCIGATIGKSGFAKVACAFNQQINAIVPNRELVLPEFLFGALSAPAFQEAMRRAASSTTLPILSKTKFMDLMVLVPPLEEQKRIATEMRRLHSIFDDQRRQYQLILARAGQVRLSVLSLAFSGKLSGVGRGAADPAMGS